MVLHFASTTRFPNLAFKAGLEKRRTCHTRRNGSKNWSDSYLMAIIPAPRRIWRNWNKSAETIFIVDIKQMECNLKGRQESQECQEFCPKISSLSLVWKVSQTMKKWIEGKWYILYCMLTKSEIWDFFLEEIFTFSPEIPPVIRSGCGGACLMPGASSDLAVASQRDGSAGLRLSLVKINKDEAEDKTSFYRKKLDLHKSRFFAPLLTICAAQDYCSISSRHTLCL